MKIPSVSHSDQLNEFVAHARAKGMDHATIRALLTASGWRERDVITALAEESLSMSIPMPPDTGGARDAFFHLLNFFCLYSGFFAVAWLFFSFFNWVFPDLALNPYSYDDSGSIRWFIATIIITAPLFFALSRWLLKDMNRNPEKASSQIRRWLTYLTLFLAAMAMVGNLITLVFYVLDGDLSIRFLCKVATLFLMSGLVFAYYFVSLRRPVTDRAWHRSFGLAAGAIVMIAIITGFAVAGSPATRRLQRLDDQRLSSVRSVASAAYSVVHGQVKPLPTGVTLYPAPKTIEELQQKTLIDSVTIRDPETGELYEYRATGQYAIEVCATFALERKEAFEESWNHPAGRACFPLDLSGPNLIY